VGLISASCLFQQRFGGRPRSGIAARDDPLLLQRGQGLVDDLLQLLGGQVGEEAVTRYDDRRVLLAEHRELL
jgi:hypothetical protein